MRQLPTAVSKMRLTTELGADFWNDSCAPGELREAVENGRRLGPQPGQARSSRRLTYSGF